MSWNKGIDAECMVGFEIALIYQATFIRLYNIQYVAYIK
jgi:hypothetical protein